MQAEDTRVSQDHCQIQHILAQRPSTQGETDSDSRRYVIRWKGEYAESEQYATVTETELNAKDVIRMQLDLGTGYDDGYRVSKAVMELPPNSTLNLKESQDLWKWQMMLQQDRSWLIELAIAEGWPTGIVEDLRDVGVRWQE